MTQEQQESLSKVGIYRFVSPEFFFLPPLTPSFLLFRFIIKVSSLLNWFHFVLRKVVVLVLRCGQLLSSELLRVAVFTRTGIIRGLCGS